MCKAGPGAGGGHAARPGEMPSGAGQLGSGRDHRGRVDSWGKGTKEGCSRWRRKFLLNLLVWLVIHDRVSKFFYLKQQE